MKTTLSVCCLLVTCAATWLLCECALTARAWRALPDRVVAVTDARLGHMEVTVDKRLASIQHDANAHLSSVETIAAGRLDAALKLSDAQMTAAREQLLQSVQQLISTTSDQLGATAVQAQRTLAAYQQLPESVAPTVNNLNRVSGPLLNNSLGAVAAAKITLGDLAKAGRTFEATSKSIDLAAHNSADASLATARVMQNFATATKPLPMWARVGLAVAPPMAQTAFAVVGSLK